MRLARDSELRQLVMRPGRAVPVGRGIPSFGGVASIHSASRTAMRIARDWRCGRRGSHVTGQLRCHRWLGPGLGPAFVAAAMGI